MVHEKNNEKKIESTHPFSDMTGQLYENIVDLWTVSDSMGSVTREIYKEYKDVCLELKKCKSESTERQNTMNTLSFNDEYMNKLKDSYTKLRKRDKLQTDEMDELRKTITDLKKKNRLCLSEKQLLFDSNKEKVDDLSKQMGRYGEVIKKLTKSAEETNEYMTKSTNMMSSVLDDHCTDNNSISTDNVLETQQHESYQSSPNTKSSTIDAEVCSLVGSGNRGYLPPPLSKNQFSLVTRRKRNRVVSINDHFDTLYDKNNKQWAQLSECIEGLNSITTMTPKRLHMITNSMTVPRSIKSDKLERSYLMFLHELQHLKKIPKKDFSYIKKILQLPHELGTIKDLKDYLSDDMYLLNRVLVTK
jgi:hypothetical protein